MKRISHEHRQLSLMLYDTRPRKYDYSAWRTLDGSDLSVQAQSAELFSFPHAYRDSLFDRRIIVARTYMQVLRLKKARASVINVAKKLKSNTDPAIKKVMSNLRLIDQRWLMLGSIPETRLRRSVIGSKSLFLFSELLRAGNPEGKTIERSLEALVATINRQTILQSDGLESQGTSDRVREILFGQRSIRDYSRVTSQLHSAPTESLICSSVRETPDEMVTAPMDGTGGVPLFVQIPMHETLNHSALEQVTDFGMGTSRNDTGRLLQSITFGSTRQVKLREIARSRPEKDVVDSGLIIGSRALSDC